MSRKSKTHEEFVLDLTKVNTNIQVFGTYINSQTKIGVSCMICGHKWETRPNDLMKGHGCPMCSARNRKAKKLTQEDFVDRISKQNPNIIVLGKYEGSTSKILCECKIDGHRWTPTAVSLLNGGGCPQCSVYHRGLSHEEFVNKVNEVHGNNIEVLGHYQNSMSQIKCLCKKCGNEWSPKAGNLIYGKQGCKCNQIKKPISHNEFIEKFKKVNNSIDIVSEYKKHDVVIRCKCKYCNTEWDATPERLLNGVKINCPSCSSHVSMPNRYMFNLLHQADIIFENEKTFTWSNGKRYDFYLPEYDAIIEMHGKQHYAGFYYGGQIKKSFKDIHKNDCYKRQLAIENGVKYYIEVNASQSNLDWLKNHILENVFLFNLLKECDYADAYKKSCIPAIGKFAALFNDGVHDINKLAKLSNISTSTAYSYKRKAMECSLIALTN